MSKEIVIDNHVYKIHPYYDLYAASVNGSVIHIVQQEPTFGHKQKTGYTQIIVRKI